ncbi:MAG: isochorismatase family protein [Actinomycetota bacterium]|nr:isochorismatase family protein [Actinomycetota bacterium]
MTQEYLPSTALIVVDMQHDFADPSGSLYVRGGEDIVAPIAAEISAAKAAGATVAFTQDWHPEHTPHFQQDGGSWPVHCVMGTAGADFVPGLLPAAERPEPVVRKGSGPEDGYSGFSVLDLTTGQQRDTELSVILDENGVMDIVVVGLAGDWCVKATAIDGMRLGYSVTVPLALTKFVELAGGDGATAVEEMRAAGVTVTD